MLSSSFFVIHDTTGRRQYQITRMRYRTNHTKISWHLHWRLYWVHLPELTARQKIICPFFDFSNWHIETWWYDAAFVQASGQVDYDLTRTMVVNDLEFFDVSCKQRVPWETERKVKLFRNGSTRSTRASTFMNKMCVLEQIKLYDVFNLPCFIITFRNLMITLEQGRINTCLLPDFSALLIDFNASLNTLIRTILLVL